MSFCLGISFSEQLSRTDTHAAGAGDLTHRWLLSQDLTKLSALHLALSHNRPKALCTPTALQVFWLLRAYGAHSSPQPPQVEVPLQGR